MPRLAVLLPVYSAEKTLGAALSTTLRALPRDSVVMTLDDGSSDSSVDVAKAFDDPRVRVRTRPNGGVASALNELLDSTDSEFVARMDADDLVLPGRFARQLKALSAKSALGRPLDAVFTTVVQFGTGARPVPRTSRIDPEDFGLHLLLTNPVAHPTLMARRAAISSVGGYRNVPTEDYDLWLRLAARGAQIKRLAAPGLAYRMHPGQVTASAEWRRASWTDPAVSAAYSTLSELLIGAPAKRITTLAVEETMTRSEKKACFAEFRESFTKALPGHSASAQRALRRKLDERARWLQDRLALEAARAEN